MTHPRGRLGGAGLDSADRLGRPSSKGVWTNGLGWIFPVVALAAPLAGDASARLLQACLMLGAAAGLAVANRSGAFWSVVVWGVATGGLGAGLTFFDAPNGPSLTLAALTAATAQGGAILGVGGPAVTAGWRARGQLLSALAGPLALALLAVNAAPTWDTLVAAVAVAVNLAALPLVLAARRRAGIASSTRPNDR